MYAATSPALLANADHMTGEGSKPLQASKNGTSVLTLWLGTVKGRNRPHRFHDLVEIRRDCRTPVVRLSGEPPRDPTQSSAPPVTDYNRLTPGEAKETKPLSFRIIKSENCAHSPSQEPVKYCSHLGSS